MMVCTQEIIGVRKMEVSENYFKYPNAGWWNAKEEAAKKMTIAQLHYARLDCFKAGQANPERQGYYLDEGCVYATEQRRRKA